MAYANVASCVMSIVCSFSNGIQVCNKLHEKRRQKKRSKRDGKTYEEEVRLIRSLRQGPEDIGREYQRNVCAVGKGFEIGDATAQTHLAEIVLRLNTGLVGIITSFLNGDRKGNQMDYHALTALSERSRIDTCKTLRQLLKRVTQRRPQHEHISRPVLGPTGNRSDLSSRRKNVPASKPVKVRAPMIAQVVIEDSTKKPQIAVVRPSERRKKSSSSASSLSKTRSESSSSASSPLATPPPEYTAIDTQRPPPQRTQTTPAPPPPRRKQSSTALPNARPIDAAARFRAMQSTPRLETTLPFTNGPPPPMPEMATLSTTDLLPRRRGPMSTRYSIMSNQTQLGEIPLHKWAEPYDFDQMSILNAEAYRNGWPLTDMDVHETKKRRFGFGRLFCRKTAR